MVVVSGLQNNNVKITRHEPIEFEQYPNLQPREARDNLGCFVAVTPEDGQLITVHVCREGQTYWSATGDAKSIEPDQPLFALKNHLALPPSTAPPDSTFGGVAYLCRDGTGVQHVCIGLFDAMRVKGQSLAQEPPGIRTQVVQRTCWEWRLQCPSVHYHYAGHEDVIRNPERCDLSRASFSVDPARVHVVELPLRLVS